MIPLQTASPHPVTHLLFSPDGSAVAVAQPHTGVTLLERATGRTLAVYAMPRRAELSGLTFCGDGRFLAASHAKGLEVFDSTTGARVLANFHGYHKYLLLAERGGAVLGANSLDSRSVRVVMKPNESGGYGFSALAFTHQPDPVIVAFSPDGRLALGAGPRRGLLLDLVVNRVLAEIDYQGFDESYRDVVARFCPFGRRFALNDGRTLDVYDTGGRVEEEEDERHADTPLVQRAGDKRPAVAPMPHVKLAPTFTLKPDRPTPGGWYPPFALLADGRGLLVRRPRNRVQLWDAPVGALVSEWSWRLEWVTCLAASPDGLTAAAGGRFGRVLLWDLDP